MDKLQAIENYIVYLIRECGLSVTLHPIESETVITFSNLMRFNIHANSYCSYIKSTKKGYEQCLWQQKKVFKKVKERQSSFCGTCHAGVFEYVYPLRNAQNIIGFISVSGYFCEDGAERILRASRQLDYSADILQRAYRSLQPPPKEQTRIDTLIEPLCQMLELLYRKEQNSGGNENMITRILRYVQNNYSMDIKAEEICANFGCSRSYFSHTFKKETGKGFREYLTDIRLANAKRLLALSDMNVTEIAMAVGFTDSNYFSNVFKRVEGVSPLAYRKAYLSDRQEFSSKVLFPESV